MDKKYCVFDMDGTLVDSMDYWLNMEREYLTSLGAVPGPPLEDLIARLKPLTLEDAARAIIGRLGLSLAPGEIIGRMNAAMEENYRLRVPVKPGAADYLSALKARGARLCTASATGAPLVRLCFERLGIASLFDFMISCVDVGASKDRPDVYFEAARRFCAAPGEIAVYEDSLRALTTAKNAGFYAVAVWDKAGDADWPRMLELADETVEDWAGAAKALA